jgi:hypothetical protein
VVFTTGSLAMSVELAVSIGIGPRSVEVHIIKVAREMIVPPGGGIVGALPDR